MNSKCEDCDGTGVIETEGLHVGRERYDKDMGYVVHDVYGKGDWAMTACPCQSED